MGAIRELARAKVNLTLEVAGRRGDGFHELASLVAFADVGDGLDLDVHGAAGVRVSGPFAQDLQGENVLARALGLIRDIAPTLTLGTVHLDKRLPVAAGLGGGSADAGALLRAVRTANASAAEAIDWIALARRLGADVAVCFQSRPLWMTGVGDRVEEIGCPLPPLSAVLVNPRVPVPADKTAQVYRSLDAAPLGGAYSPPAPPHLSDRAALLDFMRERGNGLTRAAMAVVPEAGAVLAVLSAQDGIEYAAVSGGGPTCFGVFSDQAAANAARGRIATAQPMWWTVAVTLG